MASRKKKLKKMVEETMNALLENFGNRITSISWYQVPSKWIAPHVEAVISVEVKRGNRDLTNTLYDIVYKQMFARNFDHLVSLEIQEYGKDEKLDNNIEKGVFLWPAT
ncbi:MAG: hypothetical protein PWQ96_2293 [Clostridia bacterium]|nr:hypothetical protein [Clostridiales bacterium]MDK2986649.1 hypothetical protein [Clostridia bacterium]